MDILKTLFDKEYDPPMLPEAELDAWLKKDYSFWERIEALAGRETAEVHTAGSGSCGHYHFSLAFRILVLPI